MELNCWLKQEDIFDIVSRYEYCIEYETSEKKHITFNSIDEGVQALKFLYPYASYHIEINSSTALVKDFETNEYEPSCTIDFPNLHKITRQELRGTRIQCYICRNNTYFPYDKEDILKTIDVYNPDSFCPYLQAMDYPYIEEEWKRLISIYGRNILGRYIAKMRLKGFRGFSWSDSAFINSFNARKNIN